MNELLKTEHLSVSFFTDAGEVEAVRDVSFTVEKGEVLAIVGESGCGKECIVQKYYEITSENSKNQVRENTGERSGYYGLYGKEYVDGCGENCFLWSFRIR